MQCRIELESSKCASSWTHQHTGMNVKGGHHHGFQEIAAHPICCWTCSCALWGAESWTLPADNERKLQCVLVVQFFLISEFSHCSSLKLWSPSSLLPSSCRSSLKRHLDSGFIRRHLDSGFIRIIRDWLAVVSFVSFVNQCGAYLGLAHLAAAILKINLQSDEKIWPSTSKKGKRSIITVEHRRFIVAGFRFIDWSTF